MLSTPEVFPDLQSMKRLWVHECLRVFSDRLVDSTDRGWFVGALRAATASRLNDNFDSMLGRLFEKPTDKVDIFQLIKKNLFMLTESQE